MAMRSTMIGAVLRREQRAQLVENIIALGELLDGPDVTDLEKRLFYETIQLEASNLKNIDIEVADSNNDVSLHTTEDNSFGDIDASNIRQISSARLLDNISALGELLQMTATSDVGKILFWEAIKLELKTFKYLNLKGEDEKEDRIQTANKGETSKEGDVAHTRLVRAGELGRFKGQQGDNNQTGEPPSRPNRESMTTNMISHQDATVSKHNPDLGDNKEEWLEIFDDSVFQTLTAHVDANEDDDFFYQAVPPDKEEGVSIDEPTVTFREMMLQQERELKLWQESKEESFGSCEKSKALDITSTSLREFDYDSVSNPSSQNTNRCSKKTPCEESKTVNATATTLRESDFVSNEAIKLHRNTFKKSSKNTQCEEFKTLDATATTIREFDSDSNPSSGSFASHSPPFRVGREMEDHRGKVRNRVCFPSKKVPPRKKPKTLLETSVVTKPTSGVSSLNSISASQHTCCTVVSTFSPPAFFGIQPKVQRRKVSCHKNERNRVRSFPWLLTHLFSCRASPKSEWLRSVKGPLQDNGVMERGVMEMVIYLTAKDGKYFITSNDD